MVQRLGLYFLFPKTMIPVFLQSISTKMYCSVCGELLAGLGNIGSPYKCKCGEWEKKDPGLKLELIPPTKSHKNPFVRSNPLPPEKLNP
jgi:hypothetical protein